MEGKRKKNGMGVCPDDETFINVFLGVGGARLEDKEKIVDHALGCKSCALKFDLLVKLQNKIYEYDISDEAESVEVGKEAQYREFYEAARQKMVKTGSWRRLFGFGRKLGLERRFRLERGLGPEIDRGRRFGLFPKKYLAAAAALVAVIGGYLVFTNLFHKEVYRDFEGNRVILMEPIGEIKGPPMYLKWKPVDRAEGYDVRIIDENLRTVALLEPENLTSIAIPEEIRAQLKPGITYIWIVEAFTDEDQKIAESKKHFVIH